MAEYELEIEIPVSTQTVKFQFTPTLENAPHLLMDIAALLESQPQKSAQEVVQEAEVQELQERIEVLEAENKLLRNAKAALEIAAPKDKKIEQASKTKAGGHLSPRALPAVGECVTVLPHDEYKFYTRGIVKGYSGRGGAYIKVQPKNHDRVEALPRKLIKRIKDSEWDNVVSEDTQQAGS